MKWAPENQISIFDIFNEPSEVADASRDIPARINELLSEYKTQHEPEMDSRLMDYSIVSAVSNEYMPDHVALMYIYALLPNHTCSMMISNKYGREHRMEHLIERDRHSIYGITSHSDRKNPKYSSYSLEEHMQQHFQTAEIDGLKIKSRSDAKQLREFIDRHEW